MFKIKKIAAFVAAAAMAVSAMAVGVSATSSNNAAIERSVPSTWVINSPTSPNSNYPVYGVVYGLVQGRDTGITFRCTDHVNPTNSRLYAEGRVTKEELCLKQQDYVELSYIGDDGTVLFVNNWYALCNGSVQYKVQAYGLIVGGGQKIQGNAL